MTRETTTYTINCGLSATDNDYIKLAELYIATVNLPECAASLRALLCGQLDVLRLHGVGMKALVKANGTTFTLLFDDGSSAYLWEDDLTAIETYVLGRWTGRIKSGGSVSRTLQGRDVQQVVLQVRAG